MVRREISDLKEQLRIPEVAANLGLGPVGKSCRSPWREDRKPSFSVYDDGKRWKDLATGEGGDVIDFIARACDVGNDEATRRFLAMCGQPLPARTDYPPRQSSGPGLKLPEVSKGNPADWEATAKSRRLNPLAVQLAVYGFKTVVFGKVCGAHCWILTDSARKIAEARRVDGRPFPAFGDLGERKAHTLAGSSKSWPAGLGVLRDNPLYQFRAILLVEGGPDYLAALHFSVMQQRRDLLPVAMLGRNASGTIPTEALELFRGRRVRIYAHADADGGGESSSIRWGQQLADAACEVDTCSFEGLRRVDGKPVKDLNDAALIAPEHETEIANLLP